ncbi:hypothetical protein HK098_001279 [Nowakowskiella sp. JEL0407]|nr:hypothetical protein HK098_001279 [Nowakowskiella sp. JEL0407]
MSSSALPYSPYPPVGGTVDPASNAWVLTSVTLVLIMVPGLGYFYSGLSHHKNALVLLHVCMLALAVVSIQWGYSLAFAPDGGPFIGNLASGAFTGVANQAYPGTVVSTDVFAIFQCMFAVLTAALPFGSAADRTRILPSIIFLFVWSTLVYDPIAYWVWAPNGWLKKLGYLDFAGGCPVEVNSGFSGLALALYMGPRILIKRKKADPEMKSEEVEEIDTELKPHNTGYVVLGTALLWFGWLGFNGGSALMADRRAGLAVIATNLAGSSAGMVWMALDFFSSKKYSSIGFCTGAIAGLVAITPAAGFVAPWAALVIGALAGLICRAVSILLKKSQKIDDTLDVFAVHGVGGVIGNICVGFFAAGWVIVDVPGSVGGWLDGNFKQMGWQLLATVSCAAWAFCITYAILFIMDRIPGLRLRVKEKHEEAGLDVTQMGEFAYTFMVSSPLVGFGDGAEGDVENGKDPRVEWGGAQTINAESEV